MGTIFPATYMRGSREVWNAGEPNFPRFTAWLGNFSSGNKRKRQLGEMHTRMLSSTTLECNRTAVRLSYLPVLRSALSAPLIKEGKDGIPEVLQLMTDYCLIRDDVDFVTGQQGVVCVWCLDRALRFGRSTPDKIVLVACIGTQENVVYESKTTKPNSNAFPSPADVTKWKSKGPLGEDPMKPVETQVKSAFTRAFNAQHLRPKTGFKLEDAARKRGKPGAAAVANAQSDDEAFGRQRMFDFDPLQFGVCLPIPQAIYSAWVFIIGDEEAVGTGRQEQDEEEEMDPSLIRQKVSSASAIVYHRHICASEPGGILHDAISPTNPDTQVMALKHEGLNITLKDGSTASGGRGKTSGRGRAKTSGKGGSGSGRGRGRKA